MVDYEKGSPGWDIGMIVTRHHNECARLIDLRRTASQGGITPDHRLASALDTACTCGAGDKPIERTSLRGGVPWKE